jgi:homotetrameric cytidine deaminase
MTDVLRRAAHEMALRAHAPYSGQPVGAAFLLDSGVSVAAPRLESASFPLTIPALQGAWALAVLSGQELVAAALSRPFLNSELAFLRESTGAAWTHTEPALATRDRATLPSSTPSDTPLTVIQSEADGLALALETTARAVVPASGFRVGAVAVDADGRAVVGANVEHVADWTRGLCAERVALVAARAAGLGPIKKLYLACASSITGTPCGGCRQLIAEQAPEAEIIMWRGDHPPEHTRPLVLLPGAFDGSELRTD